MATLTGMGQVETFAGKIILAILMTAILATVLIIML
jgi:hypothetical protein